MHRIAAVLVCCTFLVAVQGRYQASFLAPQSEADFLDVKEFDNVEQLLHSNDRAPLKVSFVDEGETVNPLHDADPIETVFDGFAKQLASLEQYEFTASIPVHWPGFTIDASVFGKKMTIGERSLFYCKLKLSAVYKFSVFSVRGFVQSEFSASSNSGHGVGEMIAEVAKYIVATRLKLDTKQGQFMKDLAKNIDDTYDELKSNYLSPAAKEKVDHFKKEVDALVEHLLPQKKPGAFKVQLALHVQDERRSRKYGMIVSPLEAIMIDIGQTILKPLSSVLEKTAEGHGVVIDREALDHKLDEYKQKYFLDDKPGRSGYVRIFVDSARTRNEDAVDTSTIAGKVQQLLKGKGDKTDAYVKVTTDIDSKRTKTVENDDMAVWGEYIDVWVEDSETAIANIELFDEDFGKDKLIRDAPIDVKFFANEPWYIYSFEQSLYDLHDYFTFRFSWRPFEMSELMAKLGVPNKQGVYVYESDHIEKKLFIRYNRSKLRWEWADEDRNWSWSDLGFTELDWKWSNPKDFEEPEFRALATFLSKSGRLEPVPPEVSADLSVIGILNHLLYNTVRSIKFELLQAEFGLLTSTLHEVKKVVDMKDEVKIAEGCMRVAGSLMRLKAAVGRFGTYQVNGRSSVLHKAYLKNKELLLRLGTTFYSQIRTSVVDSQKEGKALPQITVDGNMAIGFGIGVEKKNKAGETSTGTLEFSGGFGFRGVISPGNYEKPHSYIETFVHLTVEMTAASNGLTVSPMKLRLAFLTGRIEVQVMFFYMLSDSAIAKYLPKGSSMNIDSARIFLTGITSQMAAMNKESIDDTAGMIRSVVANGVVNAAKKVSPATLKRIKKVIKDKLPKFTTNLLARAPKPKIKAEATWTGEFVGGFQSYLLFSFDLGQDGEWQVETSRSYVRPYIAHKTTVGLSLGPEVKQAKLGASFMKGYIKL